MTRYKCPNCGEEITYLSYGCKTDEFGSVDLNNGSLENYDIDDYGDNYEFVYTCRECGLDLGETEQEVFAKLIVINEEKVIFKIGDRVELKKSSQFKNQQNGIGVILGKQRGESYWWKVKWADGSVNNYNEDNDLKLVNEIKEVENELYKIQIINTMLYIWDLKNLVVVEFPKYDKKEIFKQIKKGKLFDGEDEIKDIQINKLKELWENIL